MTTPIFDFVKKYSESKTARFHMPGHKGVGELGLEAYDITEISGADVLYSAKGIIEESEANLTSLYGTEHSFYSTEGSTLAIKAMLKLVSERREGERPLILAARNAHAAFIKAAALLDLDVEWIYSSESDNICVCNLAKDDLRASILALDRLPNAVYVTSPDYLGNMQDIGGLAEVCDEFKIPLLVDNAHGAYLKFLKTDMHPITLGAAMCADSAHKTLPALTGGAYLHVSKRFPKYAGKARCAMSLFASTSPSYLTLSSLDLCNARLGDDYAEKIAELAIKAGEMKKKIDDLGFALCSGEPLKIVIKEGEALAEHLRACGIEVEFSDYDYTVLMLTPSNTDEDFDRLIKALSSYEFIKKSHINSKKGEFSTKYHKSEMSIRSAMLSQSEIVPTEMSVGRICAAPTVSCPPAVPIVISGERISDDDVKLFKHYGIESIMVVVE